MTVRRFWRCAKTYWRTVLLALLLVAAVAPREHGPLLAVLLPVMLIYFAVAGVRLWRASEQRRLRSIRLLMWLVALVVSGLLHWRWSVGSQQAAADVVRAVQQYQARTGSYPDTLVAVDRDEVALGKNWGIRYVMQNGTPRLSYPAQILPLSRHEYDFQQQRWQLDAH